MNKELKETLPGVGGLDGGGPENGRVQGDVDHLVGDLELEDGRRRLSAPDGQHLRREDDDLPRGLTVDVLRQLGRQHRLSALLQLGPFDHFETLEDLLLGGLDAHLFHFVFSQRRHALLPAARHALDLA